MRKWSILAFLAIGLILSGCNILGPLFGTSEEETYTLTYHAPDASGGYPAVTSQSYKPGSNVTVAGYGTLFKDGSSPVGWRDTIRGVTYSPGDSFTMPSDNMNLYIQWSSGSLYTLSFSANAPDAIGSTASISQAAGTVALSANGFSRPGYSFIGWSTSAGGEKVYDDQATYSLNGTATLYAVWQAQVTQYFISFNGNGGTGFMPAQQAYSGTAINLSANTFGAPVGYVFLGWATRADGPKVYDNQALYSGAANITLFAYWQLQTADTYTITFDPNALDATGSTPSVTQVPGEVILSANGFARSGYKFVGWASSSEGMVAYTDMANFLLGTSDVTLYAIWELDAVETYTIWFNGNAPLGELSGTTGSMTAVVDKQISLTPNGFARIGYNFLGWALSAADAEAGTIAYVDQASYIGTADLTLFAVWELGEQLYIYYAANDETGANSLQYVSPNSSVILFDIFVNRSGYDFLGWSEDSEATVASYSAGSTYEFATESMVLYAVWVEQVTPEYWIYFNPNASGVLGYMNPIQSAPGTVILTTSSYIRTGYDFLGWSTNPLAVTAVYTDGGSFELGSGDALLFAIWSAQTYEDIDIGFGDDGQLIDISFGDDGEEIEIIAN